MNDSHAQTSQEILSKPPNSGTDILSDDHRLNKMLKSVVLEVKRYAEDQINHINKRAHIGLALSIEKNINKLLEMIVDEARDLTKADGGTLYTVDPDKTHMCFEIMQNDTLNTRMGGTSGIEITLPRVPLYKDGKPNHSNVCSYVALTEKTVNIPDVYTAEGFDFTGTRNYDATTGYRSKSMLVFPLKNHENDIIGVLQLLNAQDSETGKVITFSPQEVDQVASLASQAAVAMTNTQLIQDLQSLLDAFIKSIATAIDEKSPYTGGHIDRVVKLTMMLADKINQTQEGKFGEIAFSQEQLEELRLATWMHDVGKITTPEYVVDKATKLQTIFDRLELIETRFDLIASIQASESQQEKLDLVQSGKFTRDDLDRIEQAQAARRSALEEDIEFIRSCNNTGEYMDDAKLSRLRQIAQKTYRYGEKEFPFLQPDELENLSIRKGTLTDDERKVIENHATMTLNILSQLPFPRRLAHVPEYAGSHHEKLDGSGYPKGLAGNQLPLQSRIMAIADVFEALTAKDRPYKEPMKLSQAVKILGFMKNDNHIDPDLCDLFIQSGLHREYAQKELNPEQIDT